MEQHRLFAWSETSGLLDLDAEDDAKIRKSYGFALHRATILDLLVQIKCLFKGFIEHQKTYKNLQNASDETVSTDDEFVNDPAEDASTAHMPLPEGRRKFIKKAMQALKSSTRESQRRLRWAAFDKKAFEDLLQKFSGLNDSITSILDIKLQTEIHHSILDTNRGVLQLHHDIASLHQLVRALDFKTQNHGYPIIAASRFTYLENLDSNGFQLLAELAKFKAFSQSLQPEGSEHPWDESTSMYLELDTPNTEKRNTKIERSRIRLERQLLMEDAEPIRCEAIYKRPDGVEQKVWIEWKEQDWQMPGNSSLSPVIESRVQKLIALLHHTPKPQAFRVPHCLGYFDDALNSTDIPKPNYTNEDDLSPRIGFVFEKPEDENIDPDMPPISLLELLRGEYGLKPRINDRIRLAHAVASCLLYLHSVNWLHKGLRSQNIVFFRTKEGKIDIGNPYLSGFEFARPARPEEQTEVPRDNVEHDIYRHPSTQGTRLAFRENFRKSFDIYSFGVVLVELAHWMTIDKVLNIDLKAGKGTARVAANVRANLLERSRILELGMNMGEIYEGAVERCLAGGKGLGIENSDDESCDHVAAKLSRTFFEDVVKKLGDIHI